ncbi:Transporter of the ATP-binding cassette (ABC) [Emydomyces testavorans]|uniref:Transporter of the ATP-binding cassette (ABC) n=1 Tax=Emydomyces testavorans TaxID=2070801 RepID=A0AAF0DCW6_9EURO|nr:Transporter of the ATP-binding cassette (ABC) [Emydomyces testavorans]
MLPICGGPVWRIDDLSRCFQERYLDLIFPLTACGISLLFIIAHVLRIASASRRTRGYKPVLTRIPAHNGVEGRETEEDEDEESDLMLHKAMSRTTDATIKLDRPRGKWLLVVIEILSVLGQVGVNAAAVASLATHGEPTIPAIARLSAWLYVLLLVFARLFVSIRERPSVPKLWDHTAALYGFLWLFIVFIFRSVIIHPDKHPDRLFVIIDFALSSFLLLLAATTRKGNKTVLIQQEEDLVPPKDQFASVFSLISFSWMDPMIWQGYKKALEMPDVWNLKPSYQAATVIMEFRRARSTSKLAWRLFRYFNRTLLIQGIWTVFAGLFTFLPTWLLKLILEYVEDPTSVPRNTAWFYVILLFVCGAIQAVGDGQSLWLGRKLSVKFRAIVIGELYAKALRRKAGASIPPPIEEEEESSPKKQSNDSKKKTKNNTEDEEVEGFEDGESEFPANIGKIINLMAIDSFKVGEICAYLHYLWASVPVQIIVAIILLYGILGVSSFAGIALMLLIAPFNMFIASQFRHVQNSILAATDSRIHATNEALQNIRIIKYFAWEQRFEDIINEKRRIELKYLRRRYILWSVAATVWYGTPFLITFATFFIYTVVEGKKLVPSIAFPALSMFSLLRVPLDRLADMAAHILESKVSIDRVEQFLNEEETEKYAQLRHTCQEQPSKIALEKATLSWGNRHEDDNDLATKGFRLFNVNVSFQVGKFNVIAGPTGSGKTSILMALLGEMRLVEGAVYLPGGTSDRTDLSIDPTTGLTESVAYCAQEAWLVNATIQENILFALPYDEGRYNAVIQACGLERDLEILDAGDQTLVGEKGISLSGGQKQRISLARAMYSNARHLLLDDCLSAVDSHTAKHIFQYALMGPLMMGRTCILVTHNVSLVLPWCDYLVVLDNGRIAAQGSAQDVMASGVLGEEYLQSQPSSIKGTSQIESRAEETNIEEREVESGASNKPTLQGTANGSTKTQKKKPSPGAIADEEKVVGGVPLSTVIMYLRAMGPWYFWAIASVVFTLQQLGSLAPNVWIRDWANAYKVAKDDHDSKGFTNLHIPTLSTANIPRPYWWPSSMRQSVSDFSVSKDVDVAYYLAVYVLLALIYILVSFFRELVLFWGSLHASWKIHGWLLRAVAHAKFRFFDSTPLGRIMNRFSKDIEAIDQEVAPTAIGMLHCMASVIMIVVLISVITPGFLIAGVFITLLYFALGALYLNTSRDLKRLESVQRSPLYQQFGETLNGVVTIRAYGDGARFILDNHRLINAYNRPYLYLWASNRWLAFRVDITGALVSFFSAVFILLNVGHIDAGAAGLSLTYAITFTENILWLVRLYSENQQNMNSVERVEEYLNVEQEARAIIPENRPPRNWPSKGAVKFVEYSTRYRSDLDLVLKRVSFSIQPDERVGIVGRTGAGKSSLALALFRGLEAESGKILIDDVDIGLIGLQDLREGITIVPQDPTLFTGTIRSNLDPFGLFTDEEIFTALRRVHLVGPATSAQLSDTESVSRHNRSAATLLDSEPIDSDTDLTSNARFRDNKNIFLNLSSPVTESGSNLSQGQRQLLCLARALLKSPKVLMMDEATASIDYATDAKIQDTLRELKDNTIITIAHRLQTIIDYDKVLVLDHGEVIEFDGPWQLISKEGGMFRSMCEHSGNMETLLEGAKRAWELKRLVDDS